MVSDDMLIRHVRDELYWDPKVSASHAIAVDTALGVVTLRGTVSSLRQRHEAKKAAERVSRVIGVDKPRPGRSSGTTSAARPRS